MKATRFPRTVALLVLLTAAMALAGLQGWTAPAVEAVETAETDAPKGTTVEAEGYILSEEGGDGYQWSQGHNSPEASEAP